MSDAYLAYLRSPQWVARKAAVIRYRGYRCERCGVEPSTGLQLHHRSYERLGHEHPEDVELLCPECHRLEHGVDYDTWLDTMERIDVAVGGALGKLMDKAIDVAVEEALDEFMDKAVENVETREITT